MQNTSVKRHISLPGFGLERGHREVTGVKGYFSLCMVLVTEPPLLDRILPCKAGAKLRIVYTGEVGGALNVGRISPCLGVAEL